MPSRVPSPVLLLCLAGLPAWGFEETVRRELVDAGVRQPVLTRAPVLLEFSSAEYPEAARRAGLTATVVLQVSLLADGGVGEVAVAQPVGSGFDEAAAGAVRRFRFTPAEVDGTPAPVQLEYAYHFVLEGPPDAGAGAGAGVLPDAGFTTATLRGTLLARGSRRRVPGALVACDGWPGAEASADEAGHFELRVPAGECRVRVAAAGFEVFQTAEVLAPGEVREVDYHLGVRANGYQTVVKREQEQPTVVRRTLSREELQKVPGSFGDPVRVIQDFPGVARAPYVLGQLIVRGANPAQTLTFFDGVEIPILFHIGGGPSVVNGEFLDRVDFFPGGFGARYGRAVGGVVDVASRKGAADTWHGSIKVDVQDAALFFEAPLADGVSLAAGARRSYIDALIPLFLPKDPQGGSLVVAPAYWDYQLRLDVGGKKGLRLDDGSQFSLFAFGADDTLKVLASGGASNTDISLDYHTLFHRLVGTWLLRRGDASFKLTPYLGYDLASIDFGTSKLDAGRSTLGLRADLGLEVSSWLALRLGADLSGQVLVGSADLPALDGTQYVSFPGADPRAPPQHLERTLATFDGALYAEGDFTLGPLTVTPGLRVSHASIAGHARDAFDPRLWLGFRVLEGTTLKGSLGLYTQPPPATSLVDPPLGTPSLGHERAFQSSLGVSQRFTRFITLDVTGFFNRRYENLVAPGATVVNSDGTITQALQANEGLGRAYGLEVLLRHEVSESFFGWVAYTFSRSEQRRAGTADPYVLSSFDQTHILTAVASLKLPFGFELGARFRYVTGRPTSPLVHDADYFQADDSRYSSTFGPTRSTRVKAFSQLDVRLDKTFSFQDWTLDLSLDVQNVLNVKNVEATSYDYRYRQAYEVSGIPILPVLGVKATF